MKFKSSRHHNFSPSHPCLHRCDGETTKKVVEEYFVSEVIKTQHNNDTKAMNDRSSSRRAADVARGRTRRRADAAAGAPRGARGGGGRGVGRPVIRVT
ncbi:hypothetical protein EVAR_7231_1 [Eumeta japonica]|uniref:Uncharacterized protein n=1 Tax=Eumeta variegata TaxID=151549 RepID=A0A4C1T297_EUMVA|nr:hypothetical protein EVAR_7231_1 [Eumeta japonica]